MVLRKGRKKQSGLTEQVVKWYVLVLVVTVWAVGVVADIFVENFEVHPPQTYLVGMIVFYFVADRAKGDWKQRLRDMLSESLEDKQKR